MDQIDPALSVQTETPPPPPDMAALSAFNPDLASQALPQLYLDGRKDLALAWAFSLDPFKQGSARSREPSHASHPLSFISRQRQGFGSLFDVAMEAQDKAFIDALAQSNVFFDAIFSKRLDAVARKAAESLSSNPSFAEFLFERLPSEPASEGYPGHFDSLAELASSACQNGRLDWLGKINSMRKARNGTGIDGAALLRKHFHQPPCPKGASALFAVGCINAQGLQEFAVEFLNPALADEVRAVGLSMLEALHALQIERSKVAPGDPRYSQTYASTAFHRAPHLTPPEWLGFFLARGLDPFQPSTDGTLCCAAAMLGANWRESARRHAGLGDKEAGRAARQAREDAILPLLEQMLASPSNPELLSRHFDASSVQSEAREIFANCRKIDFLGLCVAQGFYRCAALLVKAGAEWKYSAKQSKLWNFNRTRFDEPDSRSQVQAYFESLALKSTSIKSSARRDAKIQKAGGEPVEAPRRIARL